jgi:hypothetical protein
VDVGKILKTDYDLKKPWEEVRQYLECVFELEDPMAKTGPGEDFQPD